MERLKNLPIVRRIFGHQNTKPEEEISGEEDGLFAPPGTYNKLLSLFENNEVGNRISIGKPHFKRWLELSIIPSPVGTDMTPLSSHNRIVAHHRIREGKNLYPYTDFQIDILGSDEIFVFLVRRTESGKNLRDYPKWVNSQESLNEALTEIDKTIKSGKIFRRGEN